MLDTTGQITFINDYLLQVTSWLREDVLGKNWFEMFLPSDIRETVRALFEQRTSDEQLVPYYENEIITCHGNRRLIRWNNTTLYDFEQQYHWFSQYRGRYH